MSSQSSNYREFRNFLDSVRQEGESGRLKDSLMFFATDNGLVESAIYKGTSDSPLLLDMVIEFYAMQIEFTFSCSVIHVAGTRMIDQGGDGLSRGSTNEGVMIGKDFLSFLPLHKSALERSPELRNWIMSWIGVKDPIFLSPSDWFVRAHDIVGNSNPSGTNWKPLIKYGTYIWTPPPAAADVAIEELRKARLKRHRSTHIVFVPRMMTPSWRKSLYKCCDLIICIPATHSFWSSHMHEPLFIGFCFPYLPHYPYTVRGTPKLQFAYRELQKVFKTNSMVDGRDILSKLLALSRKFSTMSSKLVRQMLYFEQRS